MSLTSHQKTDFDSRLLEIEELFRQRQPDIAYEAIKNLDRSHYNPEGFELGLFDLLKARGLFNAGQYSESLNIPDRFLSTMLNVESLKLYISLNLNNPRRGHANIPPVQTPYTILLFNSFNILRNAKTKLNHTIILLKNIFFLPKYDFTPDIFLFLIPFDFSVFTLEELLFNPSFFSP